jgi:AcrR family transcriptional regulator
MATTGAVPAKTRKEQRLITRNRIYGAAVAEFKRVGFHAAQIDKIVQDVGVAHGTFYVHFPTKQHVLLEMRHRSEARTAERLRKSWRKHRSIRESLRLILEEITRIEDRFEDAQVGREVLAMYAREPVDPASDSFPLMGTLRPIFEQAVEQGELRRDIAPEALLMTFLHSLFGFLLATPTYGKERLAAFGPTFEILLEGMGPANGRTRRSNQNNKK